MNAFFLAQVVSRQKMTPTMNQQMTRGKNECDDFDAAEPKNVKS